MLSLHQSLCVGSTQNRASQVALLKSLRVCGALGESRLQPAMSEKMGATLRRRLKCVSVFLRAETGSTPLVGLPVLCACSWCDGVLEDRP